MTVPPLNGRARSCSTSLKRKRRTFARAPGLCSRKSFASAITFQFRRHWIMDFAGSNPLHTTNEQRLKSETLHRVHIVPQAILAHAAFAEGRNPDDRLMQAAVLWIDGFVRMSGGQHHAFRGNYG